MNSDNTRLLFTTGDVEGHVIEYQTGMKLIVLPRTHVIHNTPVLAAVVYFGVNVPRT